MVEKLPNSKTLTFCSCTIPCACHPKRHLNVQKWSEPLVFLTFWLRNVLGATAWPFSTSQLRKIGLNLVFFCTFWLQNVLRATTACTFSTSQLPKVVREWCVLYILTSKCASRHNGVHFFDISTSKSAPRIGVFCIFWLRNVLRATTACTFSSLIWPDGSARAALASLLFDPPEPQITNHWKNKVFRDFPTFSRIWASFFSLLWSSLFYSSLLWLFPSLLFICPYCRKFDF